jgi:hypothetical protein
LNQAKHTTNLLVFEFENPEITLATARPASDGRTHTARRRVRILPTHETLVRYFPGPFESVELCRVAT